MTHEQFQRAIAIDPFIPFTICMADGQRISISHPETVTMGPGPMRTCVAVSPDGKYRVIDLLLATTLEFEAETTST